jgi:Fe-S cluster assembly iron-binding protein IscA
MDVATGPEKNDTTISKAGIKVFLEKEADALLSDATIDYSDVQGFMITGMPQNSCCS